MPSLRKLSTQEVQAVFPDMAKPETPRECPEKLNTKGQHHILSPFVSRYGLSTESYCVWCGQSLPVPADRKPWQ